MRPPRQIATGSYYHIGSRGNFKQAIVQDDFDRRSWIQLAEYVTRKVDWLIAAYCLMTNHFHLVLQAGEEDVSAAMQVLNSEFSRRSNRRHGRAGHLFENRFYSKRIRNEKHFRAACAYVVLNPCAAGVCDDPADWPWSSHRATLGLDLPPSFLSVGELLKMFGRDAHGARAAYDRLVRSRHGRVSDTEFWTPPRSE
jgi:putative transposase